MIDSILKTAIERRYVFLSLVFVVIGIGLWSYRDLPIDAVPDITNVQVQINTEAPGYSPLESEQRITYPVETALAGLPKLAYTRSLSRYGLSQVTVVFEDGTDLYFARNLISERLAVIKTVLPEGLEPEMGPIATGLGEIFMYTVAATPGAVDDKGRPYDALSLREIQDWIIKPQLSLVPGVIEVNTRTTITGVPGMLKKAVNRCSFAPKVSWLRLKRSSKLSSQTRTEIQSKF